MREVADENTLIMAAADGSRTSFGCSFMHSHTWFTEALMNALAQKPDFEEAFKMAAGNIAQREGGGEAHEHSNPQIHAGTAVRKKLLELEARVTKGGDWEPPVMKTEAGKVQQLMGDYFTVVTPAKGERQVYWLQLQKRGTPAGGIYRWMRGSRDGM